MIATPDAALADALIRARAHSPFLRDLLDRGGEVAEALERGDLSGALATAGTVSAAEPDVMAELRRERSAYALALGLADLAD